MPEETKKPAKKPGAWSAARQRLTTWDKPALLALVKDLYDAAAVNRDFIQARCQADESGGSVDERWAGTTALSRAKRACASNRPRAPARS